MRIKILKNWRISLAFIMMAIFINWQIISAATKTTDSRYSRDHYGNLQDAIVAFHSDVNNIFNTYIQGIVTSNEPSIEYPENGECTEGNVSTYCLSAEIVPLFIEYLAGLDDHAQYITDSGDATSSITDVTDIAQARSRIISNEKSTSLEVLDFALSAYNEFQIMYPLHKEYKKLIEDFETYNEELGDWRIEISEWPNDFVDVSTTDCK